MLILGNTDLGMHAKKSAESKKTLFSRERAIGIIRESCQYLCNIFNLFRGRSKFIYLLLEDLLENYCTKIDSRLALYEACLALVTSLTQTVVQHLSIDKSKVCRPHLDTA